jgi:hypothetical protein
MSTPRSGLRRALPAAAAVLPVALLALVHLAYPFDDDQGLFAYGARALAHGARLYLDFWDLKQPGIYWYYVLGGSLFGFDEVGIHLFDLLWTLALGVLLHAIARRRLRPVALLVPLLCLGPFFAKAEPIHFSQIEIIVVLPLTLVLALLLRARAGSAGSRRDFALVGALAMLVAVFKLMLAAIPAAMLAVVVAGGWRAGPRALLREALAPAAAGALAVALPVLGWLWHAGNLEAALWVAFTYPPLALSEYAWQPLWRLADSAAWFGSAERFLLPLILLGAWRELVLRRSRLGVLLATWLLVGAAAVLAQVLSWWQYHFDLFFVPCGLFAASGLALLARLARRRLPPRATIAAAGAAAVVLAVAVSIAHKLQRDWLVSPTPLEDRMAWMIRVEPRMGAVAEGAALLAQPDARAGAIANLGDPRIFLYAQRPALLALNGSGYMLARQWREAAHLLERERPAWIYLGPDTRYIWSHGGDALEQVVESHYRLRLRDRRKGLWYELEDGAGPMALAGSH